MSPVFKCFSAAGLVVAGFFAASLFGPPSALTTPQDNADTALAPQLLPLDAGELAPTSERRLADSGVTPATFNNPTSGPVTQPAPEVHAAHYPQPGSSPSPWTDSLADSQSPAFAVPAIRRDAPTGSLPPEGMSDGGFAQLSPPPRLGEFQGTAPSTPAASPPTEPPPATFATQPSSPSSPWWQRAEGAATASAPQPWSTHAPTSGPSAAGPQTVALGTVANWQQTSSSDSRRWHVVSDGDSLPRLAERYLHDATRAQEIFEENRNVLDNPEVLPIGVELRIPDVGPRQATLEVYDAAGVPHGDIQTRRRMVKLPDVSPAMANAPVARLRAPQSAGPGN